MAYKKIDIGNANLLLRTFRSTFDLRGRSRRLEVVYYYIAAISAAYFVGLLSFANHNFYEFIWTYSFEKFVFAILIAPSFALFVRRVHDHGRSGWWLVSYLFIFLVNFLFFTLSVRHAPDFPPPSHTLLRNSINGILTVVVVVLIFWPPSEGKNRYGPDPRLE